MKQLYLILFLMISMMAGAQVLQPGFNGRDTLAHEPNLYSLTQDKKLDLSFEVGTTFGVVGNHGNYFGTYVSPRLQYPVSNRFTARAGMVITHLSGNGFYSPFESRQYSGRTTGSLVFVEGAYKVNSRLTLTGATFHEIDVEPSLTRDNKPLMQDNSYKGVIMGLDYQLGENVFIRGQVEFSNGRSPYGFSPMYRSAAHPFFNPYFD